MFSGKLAVGIIREVRDILQDLANKVSNCLYDNMLCSSYTINGRLKPNSEKQSYHSYFP